MIKVRQIQNRNRVRGCDNCNRQMPLILEYKFLDKGVKEPYVKLALCEDCSGAMTSLHVKCMKEDKRFIYDLDEIREDK